MEALLYNDVGGKYCNDPKYYLMAITAWNFQMDTIKLLKTKRRLLYLKTQFVPRGKHFSSRL